MFLRVQHNIEIARPAAVNPAFAKARKANASSVLYSRGNFRVNGSLPQDSSLSFALRTGICNYATRALAGWARPRDAEETLLIANLSTAAAGPASGSRFAGRRAGPPAVFTRFMAPH